MTEYNAKRRPVFDPARGRPTAIVVVSHSGRLAEGVRDLVAPMAPDVVVRPLGGRDGELGTDEPAVVRAVTDLLDAGHEVLMTADLGSSGMTAEMVAEATDVPGTSRRVVWVDAPIVRGTLAGAVEAQSGAGAEACARSARRVLDVWERRESDAGDGAVTVGAAGAVGPAGGPTGSSVGAAPAGGVETTRAVRTVYLADAAGLHARPAVAVLSVLRQEGARLSIDGREASSLQEILALGLHGGTTIRIEVVGPHAQAVAERVVEVLTTPAS